MTCGAPVPISALAALDEVALVASTVATAQGCIAASGGSAHATAAAASVARTGDTPDRGTFGSRIAISRPSSC